MIGELGIMLGLEVNKRDLCYDWCAIFMEMILNGTNMNIYNLDGTLKICQNMCLNECFRAWGSRRCRKNLGFFLICMHRLAVHELTLDDTSGANGHSDSTPR